MRWIRDFCGNSIGLGKKLKTFRASLPGVYGARTSGPVEPNAENETHDKKERDDSVIFHIKVSYCPYAAAWGVRRKSKSGIFGSGFLNPEFGIELLQISPGGPSEKNLAQEFFSEAGVKPLTRRQDMVPGLSAIEFHVYPATHSGIRRITPKHAKRISKKFSSDYARGHE